MYTIIKKERLKRLESSLSTQEKTVRNLSRDHDVQAAKFVDLKAEFEGRIKELSDENERLVGENERLVEEVEKLKSAEADTNSVTLSISDDLTSIIPLVRYKPDLQEKLIQAHYLSDGNVTSHAIQLALMLISHEGLEQILEQFGHPMSKEED